MAEARGVDVKAAAPFEALSAGRHHMWVVRRIGLGILTLVLMSMLVFAATEVLPGDPARAILGHLGTPQQLAALRHQLGLDRPLVVQYGSWLEHIATGHLGHSLVSQESVSELIRQRTINSAILVLIAGAIAIPLSVLIGAVSGRHRDKVLDHGVLGFSLVVNMLPSVIITLLLLVLFATTVFHILPATVILSPGQNPLTEWRALILPVAALVLGVMPYIALLVRGSVIDVYESEYVRMARLKGVPERPLLWRHVLRNALVPAIQGSAVSMAYLVGGVVVVEQVFNYPGLGTALVSGVDDRDLPVVQAIALIFGASYVIFNLIGDILTVYLTPRLRTADR